MIIIQEQLRDSSVSAFFCRRLNEGGRYYLMDGNRYSIHTFDYHTSFRLEFL
jgi:hypothetical protein